MTMPRPPEDHYLSTQTIEARKASALFENYHRVAATSPIRFLMHFHYNLTTENGRLRPRLLLKHGWIIAFRRLSPSASPSFHIMSIDLLIRLFEPVSRECK